jgi:hypothetical protein
MKLVTGAILLLAAEQAYAQAHLIQYPNASAADVLLPASLVLLVLGILMTIWGLVTEVRTAGKS